MSQHENIFSSEIFPTLSASCSSRDKKLKKKVSTFLHDFRPLANASAPDDGKIVILSAEFVGLVDRER